MSKLKRTISRLSLLLSILLLFAGPMAWTGGAGAEPAQPTPTPTRAPFAFGVSFLSPDGQAGTVYRGVPNSASPMAAGDPDELAAEALTRINIARQAVELPPLSYSEALTEAAREHAKDLLSNSAFQHQGSDGGWPVDRALRHGHPATHLGENLAVGYATAREAVDAWLANSGSRANLLEGRFTHAGLAFVHNGPWHNYWVLMLGDPPAYQPGRVLVRFQPTDAAASARETLARMNATSLGRIGSLDVERLSVPLGQERATVDALQQNPAVAFAELDGRVQIALDPNDPYYDDKWWWEKIQAADAWDVTTGSDYVVIAVIDTGVDVDHPDLAAKLVPGYDFFNDDDDPDDDHGHGTHVAGIAAAATNNLLGVAGLSWGARIMPLKALPASGSGFDSHVAEATAFAADHGAKIINLSLGGPDFSSTMAAATDYAHGKGVFIAAAAGNSGILQLLYPAANEHVVGVAATTSSDTRASFSNYGTHVDIAAPGQAIYSTSWTGDLECFAQEYCYKNGTSMATPFVSGLAALVWSVNPALTADEVDSIIKDSADDLGDPGADIYFGWGRINAHRAVSTTVRPAGFYLSGRISTTHGTPAASVTVTVSGTNVLSTTYTDALGFFFQTDLISGTYTLTPYQENTSFVPISQTVTVESDNVTGINFTREDFTVYLPLIKREYEEP
jgi:subtilisin family serine protease/uncharacterized protein YkwD